MQSYHKQVTVFALKWRNLEPSNNQPKTLNKSLLNLSSAQKFSSQFTDISQVGKELRAQREISIHLLRLKGNSKGCEIM